MLSNQPGNANLPIGGFRNANREIGVPGDATIRFEFVDPQEKKEAPVTGYLSLTLDL
jgi:hypothetical protein